MTNVNFTKSLLFSLILVLSSYVNGQDPLACNPTATPGEICIGQQSQLMANAYGGSGNYTYSWTSNPPGFLSDLLSPLVTPSQTTTYFVTVEDDFETVQGLVTVTVYPSVQIDETNFQITPTTCNGASGSITGLTALGPPPFAFQWLDLSGNPFGTNIDATGLPAGQFQLTITDGNGCETESPFYTIEDAGNLQVLDVELTQPHCDRPDGQIIVHALSPSGSTLEYSINDGAVYSSDSIFIGLFPGTYFVRIRDGFGCEGFYLENPVILTDIPGPQVTQVNVTDETDFLGNGSVEIIATGSTPHIFYSIDNGSTWQSNNGAFTNLPAGIYTCIVKDENDCYTTFTIEIQNIILTYLQANTSGGEHCPGMSAMVAVNVDNFNSVAAFRLKLSYNTDNLQCEGFTNVHPQLVDSLTVWVDIAEGVINMAWNSPSPATFSQPVIVAELVFSTKNPGQGDLAFNTGLTQSYFTNSAGNPIPAEFQNGEVNIYEPPEIILPVSKTVIVGETVSIAGIATSNHPPVSYQWTYPNGQIHTADPYFASVTLADAGVYTLMATDAVGCTDQKSINLIVNSSSYGLIENNATRMVIYLNPTNDVLNIHFEAGLSNLGAQFYIYDIQGKTMVSKQIQQEKTNINIGNLNPGVYIIRVDYNQSLVTRKLIVY